ncbi:MAG: V-type ATP synthase subunit D, partial [Clostridiales bacterium]|nr:V-type ATP synthase subunit D [Clostridiales bacterium]
MARLNVNPTRMEQTRLRRRLVTARRGHKLLKDKRDELMRQFLEIVRHNLELRKKVESALEKAYASFTIASAVMSPEMIEEALMYPKQSVSLELSTKNIMSVNVPIYRF